MINPVMQMEEYVNTVLRPLLRGDGGEVEFVSCGGGVLRLRLRGECSFCAKAELCMDWCEEKILRDLGKTVKIAAEKKRPYFRDK
jgi:Fe-S cluster biogenesis protein NfuA